MKSEDRIIIKEVKESILMMLQEKSDLEVNNNSLLAEINVLKEKNIFLLAELEKKQFYQESIQNEFDEVKTQNEDLLIEVAGVKEQQALNSSDIGKSKMQTEEMHNEIELMKQKNQDLECQLEEQRKIVKQQDESIKILKLKKTLDKEDKTTDVKLRINEIVKEVDKCISLLNE